MGGRKNRTVNRIIAIQLFCTLRLNRFSLKCQSSQLSRGRSFAHTRDDATAPVAACHSRRDDICFVFWLERARGHVQHVRASRTHAPTHNIVSASTKTLIIVVADAICFNLVILYSFHRKNLSSSLSNSRALTPSSVERRAGALSCSWSDRTLHHQCSAIVRAFPHGT